MILKRIGNLFGSGGGGAIATDPICKMEVDISNPPGGRSDYHGVTYYFCAPGCKRTFEESPEQYLPSP